MYCFSPRSIGFFRVCCDEKALFRRRSGNSAATKLQFCNKLREYPVGRIRLSEVPFPSEGSEDLRNVSQSSTVKDE